MKRLQASVNPLITSQCTISVCSVTSWFVSTLITPKSALTHISSLQYKLNLCCRCCQGYAIEVCNLVIRSRLPGRHRAEAGLLVGLSPSRVASSHSSVSLLERETGSDGRSLCDVPVCTVLHNVFLFLCVCVCECKTYVIWMITALKDLILHDTNVTVLYYTYVLETVLVMNTTHDNSIWIFGQTWRQMNITEVTEIHALKKSCSSADGFVWHHVIVNVQISFSFFNAAWIADDDVLLHCGYFALFFCYFCQDRCYF